MGRELCVCVCPLPHSLSRFMFFWLPGSVCPSVFESIKYLGSIHLLFTCSFSRSRSLSCWLLFLSVSLHIPSSILLLPVYLLSQCCRSISLWQCLSIYTAFFSLLWFSYLREAEAPPLFQPMFFLSFVLPLFLFLSWFPSPSAPLFCLCLSRECCYQER